MDGDAIPGTAGAVNPSLTTSGLAERHSEHIINDDDLRVYLTGARVEFGVWYLDSTKVTSSVWRAHHQKGPPGGALYELC